MKTKLTLPGDIGGEIQVSKQEMGAITKFFRSVVPGFVADSIGVVSDNAKFMRWKNFIRITEEARKISEKYNLPTQQKSFPLNFEIPFIEAASQQEDSTMQQMWASLLANTSGGNNSARVIYISLLRELSPAEAFILNALYTDMIKNNITIPNQISMDLFEIVRGLKDVTDDTSVIIDNLMRLKLIDHPSVPHTPFPHVGGVPFSYVRDSLSTPTSLVAAQNQNKEVRKLAEYLEREARNTARSIRNIQLTSLGYSLIRACNEPKTTK